MKDIFPLRDTEGNISHTDVSEEAHDNSIETERKDEDTEEIDNKEFNTNFDWLKQPLCMVDS